MTARGSEPFLPRVEGRAGGVACVPPLGAGWSGGVARCSFPALAKGGQGGWTGHNQHSLPRRSFRKGPAAGNRVPGRGSAGTTPPTPPSQGGARNQIGINDPPFTRGKSAQPNRDQSTASQGELFIGPVGKYLTVEPKVKGNMRLPELTTFDRHSTGRPGRSVRSRLEPRASSLIGWGTEVELGT